MSASNSVNAGPIYHYDRDAPKPQQKFECKCGGSCLCHFSVLLAVRCPHDCKERALRFDGCHRCDCAGRHV